MRKLLKHWDRLVLSILIAILATPCILLAWSLANQGAIYETNDIADYGKIKGNCDNDAPREFIFSFFPETISDSFSDVSYHYKAKYGDAHAYECCLEFVIEDPAAYQAFLDEHIDRENTATFPFEETFMEYSFSNYVDVRVLFNEYDYYWANAKIGKVLYNDAQQRILFYAQGMFDGGGAYVSELNYFFEKFDINIEEYMQTADPPYAEPQFIEYDSK